MAEAPREAFVKLLEQLLAVSQEIDFKLGQIASRTEELDDLNYHLREIEKRLKRIEGTRQP